MRPCSAEGTLLRFPQIVGGSSRMPRKGGLTFSRTARSLFALTALAACATAAQSATLTVSSYDMPNGDGHAQGGTYNYWDGTYTGSGATPRWTACRAASCRAADRKSVV